MVILYDIHTLEFPFMQCSYSYVMHQLASVVYAHTSFLHTCMYAVCSYIAIATNAIFVRGSRRSYIWLTFKPGARRPSARARLVS